MLVFSGERGCLGVGCVVAGGVLPVWLRDGVVQGGVSVGFGVGGRAFVLSGVGVPVFCVAAFGSGVGGVRVCVSCAVRVFGDSWCFLVLRRWARAVGVDGVEVGVLLGSASGSGSGSVVSGSVLSSGGGVVSSGLFSFSSLPVSGGFVSLCSPVGGGCAWCGVWGVCVCGGVWWVCACVGVLGGCVCVWGVLGVVVRRLGCVVSGVGCGLRSWVVLFCLGAAVLVSGVLFVSWSASVLVFRLWVCVLAGCGGFCVFGGWVVVLSFWRRGAFCLVSAWVF